MQVARLLSCHISAAADNLDPPCVGAEFRHASRDQNTGQLLDATINRVKFHIPARWTPSTAQWKHVTKACSVQISALNLTSEERTANWSQRFGINLSMIDLPAEHQQGDLFTKTWAWRLNCTWTWLCSLEYKTSSKYLFSIDLYPKYFLNEVTDCS